MSNLRDRINGNSLFLLSQITVKTCRFQVSKLHHLEEAQATGQPILLVAWHGLTMMLVGFFAGFYDLSSVVLILPDDWRGGALSVFSRKLGANPFPMNLTGERNMATARRLATLVRRVKEGCNCYITPDGPDGPAYVIKPGVAYIARKTKAVILPLGAYARHGYRLNRWDQYILPYPFGRISIDLGAPIRMEQHADDFTAINDRLTATLHQVTAQAAANYYEQKP